MIDRGGALFRRSDREIDAVDVVMDPIVVVIVVVSAAGESRKSG